MLNPKYINKIKPRILFQDVLVKFPDAFKDCTPEPYYNIYNVNMDTKKIMNTLDIHIGKSKDRVNFLYSLNLINMQMLNSNKVFCSPRHVYSEVVPEESREIINSSETTPAPFYGIYCVRQDAKTVREMLYTHHNNGVSSEEEDLKLFIEAFSSVLGIV